MHYHCGDSSSPSSSRRKYKLSICCFSSNSVETMPLETEEDRTPTTAMERTTRSPYTWLKSTANEFERCHRVKARIGSKSKNQNQNHQNRNHRQRHNSGDYSYDPSSYALNFENSSVDDEFYRSFSSRLPVSPTPSKRDLTTVVEVRTVRVW